MSGQIQKVSKSSSRRLNPALAVVPAIPLPACASTPYRSVEDGPRAQLTVRKAAETAEFKVFLSRSDDNCKLVDLGVIDLQDADTVRTVFVRPGRVHFASVLRETGFEGKWNHVSYELAAGEEYLLEYQRLGVDTSVYPARLQFRVNHLRVTGGGRTEVVVGEFEQCG